MSGGCFASRKNSCNFATELHLLLSSYFLLQTIPSVRLVGMPFPLKKHRLLTFKNTENETEILSKSRMGAVRVAVHAAHGDARTGTLRRDRHQRLRGAMRPERQIPVPRHERARPHSVPGHDLHLYRLHQSGRFSHSRHGLGGVGRGLLHHQPRRERNMHLWGG